MSDSTSKIDALRASIDTLDEQIVALLNRRAEVVVAIGQNKRDGGAATYVPDRERAVLGRVTSLNEGPLSDVTIAAVYRELMSGSFSLERPPRIAYLGPVGSFSHLAATRKFGSSVEFEALGHIGAVFDEIERGRVDLALVPVENSVGGGIVDTLDAFLNSEVRVCAEINLAVHHHLLGRSPIDKITQVFSKPEVFGQCQRWLVETGLMAKTIAVASTSEGARAAADQPNTAAIGSTLAGEIFGLKVLADRIEDDPNNVTRFLVLGKMPAKPTGDDKTAVYFNAADRPGTLVQVLDAFRECGVNMTFIQSRPSRVKSFDYAFFVDLEGHVDTAEVSAAIDKARAHCTRLKILGSFPRARDVV